MYETRLKNKSNIIYMSKLKSIAKDTVDMLSELKYASVPYIGSIWEAISTGNILKASPLSLALTAKEHYYQYNELIQDTLMASLYVSTTGEYIDYLKTVSVCHLKELIETHKTLAGFIHMLTSDKGINAQLNAQQLLFNNTLRDYRDTHNVNTYIKNVQQLSEKVFVKSWPGWYRIELNSLINRLNVLIDNASIELSSKTSVACALKPKIKVTAPMPVSLDQEDDEIFYDAVSRLNGGGRRRIMKK
jgi:hypothetical protein